MTENSLKRAESDVNQQALDVQPVQSSPVQLAQTLEAQSPNKQKVQEQLRRFTSNYQANRATTLASTSSEEEVQRHFAASSEKDVERLNLFEQLSREAHAKSRMHGEYMEAFVSTMRMRYSWGIFSLLLFWLFADLSIILIYAAEGFSPCVIGLLGGIGFGHIIGFIWGYACRNRRNTKDIKRVYHARKSKDIDELIDRNIQLRIWRGTCSAPIHLASMLGMGVICGVCTWLIWPNFIRCSIDVTVVITMITTTTVSVIGLLIVVLKWFFPETRGTKRQPCDNKESLLISKLQHVTKHQQNPMCRFCKNRNQRCTYCVFTNDEPTNA